FSNVQLENLALAETKKELQIAINESSNNPGANNLFQSGDITITCEKGDDVLDTKMINFIKIDVEGYEFFALTGLKETIARCKPIIVFEFDIAYQQKAKINPLAIFEIISPK